MYNKTSKLNEINSDVSEYSAAGLSGMLEQLLRMHSDEFQTEFERANFYKKQTNTVMKKLKTKCAMNSDFIVKQ
jgi:hypothetical protein